MTLRGFQILLLVLFMSAAVLAHTDKRHARSRSSQIERTIAVDSRVTVSACSIWGGITVHGWERNEVRVRSSEAAEIRFQRRDDGVDGTSLKKLEVIVLDKERSPNQPGFCDSSSEIEMDVPRGASVQLRTRDSDINVDGVATAYVNTQNGDVMIERATTLVEAGSLSGGITLQNSSGRINLHSAGGSIEADAVSPAEPGDSFEARSLGGEIRLTQVSHARLNAHTLNGSLWVTGPLARTGRYSLRTMSGDMTLSLPADSSFQLNAKFSQDSEIVSDFPLTLLSQSSASPSGAPAVAVTPSEPVPPPDPMAKRNLADTVTKVKTKVVVEVPGARLRRLLGVYGSGDAKLDLSSFSGTIHLQKQ